MKIHSRVLVVAETFSYTTFIVPPNAIKLILYILFSQNDYKNFRRFVGPASQLPSRTYRAYEYTQSIRGCGRVRFRMRTGAQSTSIHFKPPLCGSGLSSIHFNPLERALAAMRIRCEMSNVHWVVV